MEQNVKEKEQNLNRDITKWREICMEVKQNIIRNRANLNRHRLKCEQRESNILRDLAE